MQRFAIDLRRPCIRFLLTVGALGLLTFGCNAHPVEYGQAAGQQERSTDISLGERAEVDLLWVIDNSGSMCQEQRQLQQNFQRFIDVLTVNPVDFNLAVTTTHFLESSSFEPVAQPGHIQSTPSPVTSFDPTCQFALDDSSDPIGPEDPGGPDVSPVRNQIQRAVDCTANPDNFQNLVDPSDDTIQCHLRAGNYEQACNDAGIDPNDAAPAELFPPSSAYRDIPLVLRASDYRNEDDSLRTQELQQDWACMSYVGTRGSAFEQGLQAANRALSPEMTGGPTRTDFESEQARDMFIQQERQEHPNYGFLRKDAKLVVTFVTDENDCSHPGDAIENSQGVGCEEDCYFATKGEDSEPLFSTSELAETFKTHVTESKGLDSFPAEDVYVASIHGDYAPYDGPTPEMCPADSPVQPVCLTSLGKARTGDRYEDFMRNFQNFFPEPSEANPDSPLTGYMCRGGIRPALEGIASFVDLTERTCVRDRILSCGDDDDCPDYQYADGGAAMGSAVCQPKGSGQTNFCNSAVQLWITPSDADSLSAQQAQQELTNSGLCIDETIGNDRDPKACVVQRSKYEWVPCQGNPQDAIELDWDDSVEPRTRSGFDGTLRYTVATGNLRSDAGTDTGN
jgi:hypothetical protein